MMISFNYDSLFQNLFYQNALIELPFGLLCLLAPNILFSHLDSRGKYVARWWSSSIISLGFIALLLGFNAVSNETTGIVFFGLFVYHTLLMMLHTRLAASKVVRPSTSALYIGFFIHSYFCLRIGYHLYNDPIFVNFARRWVHAAYHGLLYYLQTG